jgi:hypothetical protein
MSGAVARASRPRRSGSPVESLDRLVSAAAAARGVVEKHYVIAGLRVLVRFAGEAMLERIGGSLAHLEAPAAESVALTINVWDSASTGTEAPPVLGTELEADGTGPIYYYDVDGVQALSRWGTLSVFAEPDEAWFWAPAPERMLSWDWASPLRAILHWWLGRHGILQVHGGAVGTADGGVLIVGRGGSGKSTTALASLAAGLRYAGDDYVAIQPRPQPWIHSLYSSGKLEPHQLARFPELEPALANPVRGDQDKAIVYAHSRYDDATISGFLLKAVLVPTIAGGTATRILPTSGSSALAALAPSTIFQLHPPQANALSEMAALVRQVPSLSLELGTELEQIPSVIRDFLETA